MEQVSYAKSMFFLSFKNDCGYEEITFNPENVEKYLFIY